MCNDFFNKKVKIIKKRFNNNQFPLILDGVYSKGRVLLILL